MQQMKYEMIKKQILKDNYIDIAFTRYLAFKETELYDETYKFATLKMTEPLFQSNSQITEENVVFLAKELQKLNPNEGTFVFWGALDDFITYAEASPTEVANIWNQLYDDSIPLKDRIDQFREASQTFNEKVIFNAPFFGYLLAAYDSHKYPLYKGSIYQQVKKAYTIDIKMGSVSDNYDTYMTICDIILTYLKTENPHITMLDVQDFLFCSTEYDKIKVESAVEYLYGLSVKLRNYKNNATEFLEEIKRLDIDILRERRAFYHNKIKINRIRFELLEKLLTEDTVTITDLEKIKNEVKDAYDTDILKAWNNFTILFQIYYAHRRKKVQVELETIHQAIRAIPEFQGFEFYEDKAMNGFDWNQQFGTDHCWLAVYETKYEAHQKALQYYVGINEGFISYGSYYGSDHVNSGKSDRETLTDVTEFSYESFYQKFVELAKQMQPESNDEETFYTEDLFEVETWMKLLKNKELFYPKVLEYIYKMYEFGGGASCKQVGDALGVSPHAVNATLRHLAGRIQKETKIAFPQNPEGKDSYWRVLFNGEYMESGHFKWMLKPNLYEAISRLHEEQKVKVEPYSKSDFLEEVFIDEELFDTIADLLDYKRNIILQGPPGVGKTFLSKRLAYALMGEKDDRRVEIVQFHQNYAYEDFVMGYRPNEQGQFQLEYGVFYDFCERAIMNPEQNYYFIIDEINRGNLSKVFGELFMLIEKEKREEYVTMGYSKEKFTVPENVFLIGTMNTADRSLAQLDVALRRRFSFVTLDPQFNSKWQRFLKQKGISEGMIERILHAVTKINQDIRDDYQLGRGYEIGHSFFTSITNQMDEHKWFEHVMTFEIKPLLEEYYFDRPEKVTELIEGM